MDSIPDFGNELQQLGCARKAAAQADALTVAQVEVQNAARSEVHSVAESEKA